MSNHLNSNLIKTKPQYNAVIGAHGLYNTEQFVLRLSPKNHKLIDGISDKPFSQHKINGEIIQAYSTYLHETIHWWQHVGSTSGLILSLCYPNQTHSNHHFIKEWCTLTKPRKSIKRWAYQGELAGKDHLDKAQALANTVVNNALDIDFYRAWILQPDLSTKLFEDRYFVSQGHCFHMAYGNMLSNISPIIDPYETYLISKDWDKSFQELSNKQVVGYYHGSPIMRRRTGVIEIFEGQACFSQMQFLASTLNDASDLHHFKNAGMLYGVYEASFKEFLDLSNLSEPSSVLDPVVDLFLLICDLSINPTEGFPCHINNFEEFVHYNDPGIRFEILSKAVCSLKLNPQELIKEHSYEEYMQVSTMLTNTCGLDHPSKIWKEINKWVKNIDEVKSLMNEQSSFDYNSENIVMRVMLSHFILFTLDKEKKPEFFCWIGRWKTKMDDKHTKVWLKHLSLFSDKADNDGIFMRKFPDKKPEYLLKTYNIFFTNTMVYNLTRQWILQDGNFSFDFSWLSDKYNEEDWRNWAEGAFQNLYGVGISGIAI